MDIYGVAILVKHNNSAQLSIDVVYLEPWQEKGNAMTLWRHYLYYGFDKAYRQLSDSFHCFESDDCTYGLCFACPKDAKSFHDKVKQKAAQELQRRDGRKRVGLKGLLGFSSSSDKTTTKKQLTIDDMSDPTDFQHLIHIGFNPMTGAFEPHNVPPEWAELFRKAGLDNDDLRDRSTATYVAKFVTENYPQENSSVTDTNVPKTVTATDHMLAHDPQPEIDESEATGSAPLPEVPSDRANLMDSIRKSTIQTLKPVSRSLPGQETITTNASSSRGPAAGGDVMAAMLAKALAERNQKVAGIHHISIGIHSFIDSNLLDSDNEADW